MIEVTDLKKSYGEVEALCGVSFTVQPGEIIGLLGPNGAGKTTLMKIITGYLHATEGTVRVGGMDVMENTRAVQELIGYLPENAPLYPELTVQSYLMMIADLRGIPRKDQQSCLASAVRAVGLEDRLVRTIGTLSKGYRQRVGLAQAIIHKPKVLILDEPTSGLDPTQIGEVRRLIKSLAQSSTVVMSTHILSEVEATCDRAVIIMRGEVMADAKLAQLAATADTIVSVFDAPEGQDVPAMLGSLDGVGRVEMISGQKEAFTMRLRGTTDNDLCPSVYRLACDNGWVLSKLYKDVRTLESVFNDLASGDGGLQ
jgi:ABC-2 type transport system ATP-binding protein